MIAPKHLWIVGGLTLLFNLGGLFDYVMMQRQDAGYMAQFSPEALAFFQGFPTWVTITWGLAVILAVIGSLQLLLRRHRAAPVFALSLIFVLATTLHNYVLSDVKMHQAIGNHAVVFTVLIFAVGVFEYLYARRMRARRVLR